MRAFMLKNSDLFDFCVIQNMGEPQAIYEKDDTPVDEYQYHGVTHYLFSNLERKVAVWSVENLEYSISTTLPMDDLKRLVQSLY